MNTKVKHIDKVKSVLTTFRLEASCRTQLEEIAIIWNTNLTKAVQRIIQEAYIDLKQPIEIVNAKNDLKLDIICNELAAINTNLECNKQLNDANFERLNTVITASAVRLLALTRHTDKITQIEHEIQNINTGKD